MNGLQQVHTGSGRRKSKRTAFVNEPLSQTMNAPMMRWEKDLSSVRRKQVHDCSA